MSSGSRAATELLVRRVRWEGMDVGVMGIRFRLEGSGCGSSEDVEMRMSCTEREVRTRGPSTAGASKRGKCSPDGG